jgi:hypothetical protein
MASFYVSTHENHSLEISQTKRTLNFFFYAVFLCVEEVFVVVFLVRISIGKIAVTFGAHFPFRVGDFEHVTRVCVLDEVIFGETYLRAEGAGDGFGSFDLSWILVRVDGVVFQTGFVRKVRFANGTL